MVGVQLKNTNRKQMRKMKKMNRYKSHFDLWVSGLEDENCQVHDPAECAQKHSAAGATSRQSIRAKLTWLIGDLGAAAEMVL